LFLKIDKWTCQIPKLVPMGQKFDELVIDDARRAAFDTISNSLVKINQIKPGSKVAIAVGSRGIGSIEKIVAGVIDALNEKRCHPFIVPAMGSHGGNDPLGKLNILAHLGITEASVGAPISQTVKVVTAGEAEKDLPIYCHEEALSADAIILVNRIKPHTDFRGVIESGLVKMASVGLGGALGAHWVHNNGYDHLAKRVKTAGEAAVQILPIQLGLAVIEGHTGQPVHIEAIVKEAISSCEQLLLKKARQLVPKLPCGRIDVLIAAEMGKDISGTGLDPIVTGRHPSGKSLIDEDIPEISRIVVLDLTDSSCGNASGIGLCDVTTRKVHDKTNFRATYVNVITSKGSASARFPIVMDSDRQAICVGLLTCGREPSDSGMVFVRNTLRLERFLVSMSLVAECEEGGAKVMGEPIELSFDASDSLICPEWIRA
jgi:hypothetical protein